MILYDIPHYTHSLTHSLTDSLTYSLTYSLTHSLIDSLTYTHSLSLSATDINKRAVECTQRTALENSVKVTCVNTRFVRVWSMMMMMMTVMYGML